jgi:hypothetical protein
MKWNEVGIVIPKSSIVEITDESVFEDYKCDGDYEVRTVIILLGNSITLPVNSRMILQNNGDILIQTCEKERLRNVS